MVVPGGEHDAGEALPLAAGSRLGKYVIVRKLGAGGMGAVYEATHSEIGKRVAVKVLSPAVAAVPGARARFLREAQLTTRVRHRHIVDVTDVGTDDGQTYLVMELLNGEDLAGRLERGSILPEDLVDIMLPVCEAVTAAHQAGITHRDLKPQNIFLVSEGRRVHPKVLDFGISKGTAPGDSVGIGALTASGALIGTPYYLAPEQVVDARAAGPASDQYALAVIVYECLTGERPFRGETLFVVFQKIVEGAVRPPRELRPEIPLGLEDVVLRAMLREPRERFDSVAAFARALLPFASERGRLLWEETFGPPTGAAPPPLPFTEKPNSSTTVPVAQAFVPALPAASMTPGASDTLERTAPVSASGGKWMATGVVLVLAAVGAFVAVRRSREPAAITPVQARPAAPVQAPPPVQAQPPVEAQPAAPVPRAAEPAAAPRPAHKPRGHGKRAPAPRTGVPVVD